MNKRNYRRKVDLFFLSLSRLVFLLWLMVGIALPALAQRTRNNRTFSEKKPSPPPAKEISVVRATPVTPRQKIAVEWFGHAFIYLTTATGVRIAFDPFAKDSVNYPFPRRLPADVVLVSHERKDHSGGDRLYGSPQVFRSVTALGLNRANGMIFKGVRIPRERRQPFHTPHCTAFIFEVEGIRFAHLGLLGDQLNSREYEAIGPIDVLFLPIGDKNLSVDELEETVQALGAKIIVPLCYQTPQSSQFSLRSLTEYLEKTQLLTKRIDHNKFQLRQESLPSQPTLYLMELL